MEKDSLYKELIEDMSISSDPIFYSAFDNRPDRATFLVREALKYLGYEDFKVLSSKTREKENLYGELEKFIEVLVELPTGRQIEMTVQLDNPEDFSPIKYRHDCTPFELSDGERFSKNNERIDLVISKEDLNNSGLPVETVKWIINETGEVLTNNQTTIFMNLENVTEENQPVKRFLRDLFEVDVRETHDPVAREILKTFKENPETEAYFEEKLKDLVQREKTKGQQGVNRIYQEKEELELEKHVLVRSLFELQEEMASLKKEIEKLKEN